MTNDELTTWLKDYIQARDALFALEIHEYRLKYSDFKEPVHRDDKQGIQDFIYKTIEDTDELMHIGVNQFFMETSLQHDLRYLDLNLLFEKASEIGLIEIPNLYSQLESDVLEGSDGFYEVLQGTPRQVEPPYKGLEIWNMNRIYKELRTQIQDPENVSTLTYGNIWSRGSNKYLVHTKTKNYVWTQEALIFQKSKFLEFLWLGRDLLNTPGLTKVYRRAVQDKPDYRKKRLEPRIGSFNGMTIFPIVNILIV